MGSCLSVLTQVLSNSPGNLIEDPDGTTEEEFNKRFMEDHVLGKGEFGVVRMVHDMKACDNDNTKREPLACKYLRKGVVFKDNTLYAPIKPEVLRGEVTILKTLNGTDYCLQLYALFETTKQLYIVTEFCAGGDMMEWVSNQQQDLRTEDVSRIAYQFLLAVSHCAKHKVIHRDIKPENVMFKNITITSPLRLIDFGSGTIAPSTEHGNDTSNPNHHTTFAGSAFYISPEMFQRTYTEKTDVWSVGVALYVLVAGYPAEQLQKAFNQLQTNKRRKLRELPNLPDNLPESYYEMLEGLLVYRHKKRKSARDMLHQEFVQFHSKYFTKDTTTTVTTITTEMDQNMLVLDDDVGISLEQIAAVAAGKSLDSSLPTDASINTTSNKSNSQIPSVSLSGSVQRHTIFLDYVRYERSLTTLLATILTKSELEQFMKLIHERLTKLHATNQEQQQQEQSKYSNDSLADAAAASSELEQSSLLPLTATTLPNEEKLKVIPIYTMKEILENEIQNDQIIPMMKQLKDSDKYNVFAYHINLLQDFVGGKGGGGGNYRKNKKDKNYSVDIGKRRKLLNLSNPRSRGKASRLNFLGVDNSNSSNQSGSSMRFISFGGGGRMRSSSIGNLAHLNSNTNNSSNNEAASGLPPFLIPPVAARKAAAGSKGHGDDSLHNRKNK